MNCNKCGSNVPMNAQFCPACGNPVQGQQDNMQQPQQPQKTTGYLKGCLIAALLFLVIGIVIIVVIVGILLFTGIGAGIGVSALTKKLAMSAPTAETRVPIVESSVELKVDDQDDPYGINPGIEWETYEEEATEEISEESSAEAEDIWQGYEIPLVEEWSLVEEDSQEEPDPALQYLLPDCDSRFLTEEDLYGFTAEECKLARNEIFARHGRKFLSEELQAYFDQKAWYVGIYEPDDFDDSCLNEYEQKNRDLIVNYEKKMGYRD